MTEPIPKWIMREHQKNIKRGLTFDASKSVSKRKRNDGMDGRKQKTTRIPKKGKRSTFHRNTSKRKNVPRKRSVRMAR